MGKRNSHFEIYLDNFHRPKSSGTMHICDVKLQLKNCIRFFSILYIKWEAHYSCKMMIKMDKISSCDPLEHIWLKNVFDPENYGFWKCDFNKSCSYLCDKGHKCIIYMI
jgi:hypothetical protein